jgi:hypothetical protein
MLQEFPESGFYNGWQFGESYLIKGKRETQMRMEIFTHHSAQSLLYVSVVAFLPTDVCCTFVAGDCCSSSRSYENYETSVVLARRPEAVS